MLAPSSWEYQEVYEPYDGEYYLDYEAPKVLTEEAIMRIEEATRIIAISQETFRGGVFTTGNSETDKILNEIIKN